MIKLGFCCLVNKWCIYYHKTQTGITFFTIHIDNIISVSSLCEENNLFKSQLKNHWDISDLGMAKFTLGISISHDCSAYTISLAQMALINHIVKQFGQSDAYTMTTPMVQGLHITWPDLSIPVASDVVAWMAHTPYRLLVGLLNYITIITCPNITFAVSWLSTILDCYRPEH